MNIIYILGFHTRNPITSVTTLLSVCLSVCPSVTRVYLIIRDSQTIAILADDVFPLQQELPKKQKRNYNKMYILQRECIFYRENKYRVYLLIYPVFILIQKNMSFLPFLQMVVRNASCVCPAGTWEPENIVVKTLCSH